MNVKELIAAGVDALIVCSAKDLHDVVLSFFDKQKESEPQKQSSDEGNSLLSADEVSKRLSVTKATLWRWKKLNYLVPVKVGRKNFYRKSDLDALSGKKGVSDEV